MISGPQFDLVLVACCGKKLPGRHPAGEIYRSSLFCKSRAWAICNGRAWAILSALYGVLNPETVIGSYDKTLAGMTGSERRVWDTKVMEDLSKRNLQRIAVLAGRHYRGWIEAARFEVACPMQGMGIGQQLAWLTRTEKSAQLELLPVQGG